MCDKPAETKKQTPPTMCISHALCGRIFLFTLRPGPFGTAFGSAGTTRTTETDPKPARETRPEGRMYPVTRVFVALAKLMSDQPDFASQRSSGDGWSEAPRRWLVGGGLRRFHDWGMSPTWRLDFVDAVIAGATYMFKMCELRRAGWQHFPGAGNGRFLGSKWPLLPRNPLEKVGAKPPTLFQWVWLLEGAMSAHKSAMSGPREMLPTSAS